MQTPSKDLKRSSSAPITPEMFALEALEARKQKEFPRWFIFNPAANKGRAKSRLKWLEKVLLGRREEGVIQLTSKRGDGIAFSESAKVKAETIVACGGDGTVNEVAQSLVGSETRLAILPLGSGNDFFKNVSATKKLDDALKAALQNKTRKVDVGKVSFSFNGQTCSRYFLNSLGLGFTGAIAKEASVSKRRGNLIYLDALRKVGKTYSAAPMRISLNAESGVLTYSESIFALTVGNGKIEGGKFKIAPDASVSDGFLNIGLLLAFPKWQLPIWVLRYLRGSQIRHANVRYHKITSATICVSEPLALHLDGEAFENVAGEIRIECVPSALTVVASQ
ncbi:MAG: diacylglycerol kinase family lipid kinase [Chloroherpetonaceae bacterium]|nr:diacylglycerol kinase family lipid kinase [Chloroherpetonaceae bacterium]MDW8438271.1 diacylglycerol kinase family lipid kinase [Chloroherpetonaceae bacterium]